MFQFRFPLRLCYDSRGDFYTKSIMTQEKEKKFGDLSTMKFIADILMVGELERFITKSKICLQENGQFKQQAKKQINELVKCQRMLFGNVQLAESQWYTPVYTKCFPYYAKKFTADGMSVARTMQSAFVAETKDRSQMLYLNYKQLLDKYNRPHSEASALLYTVAALSAISRRISERIYEQMEIVLYGRKLGKHPQNVNNKLEHCVKEILKSIGSGENFELKKQDYAPVADYIDGITKSLVSDEASKLVCKVFEEFTFTYVDYCIAQMVIDAQGKGLPDNVWLELNEMLGKDGYAEWVKFLESIEVDEEDDTMDVMDKLPKDEDGSLLTNVRQVLLERLPYIEELTDSIAQ